MRAIALSLLVLGCHHEPDLGSRPHLLGKLETASVHDTRAQIASLDPTLLSGTEIDDGQLTYRIEWDSSNQISSIITFVHGAIDDVLDAWGPGTPGAHQERRTMFYFDPLHRTRYEVATTSTEGMFFVRATPYRKLENMLDDISDVKLYGVDILALAPDDVRLAMSEHELVPQILGGADSELTVIRTEHEIVTDVCPVTITVASRDRRVMFMSIRFLTAELPYAADKLNVLFAHKWGTPDRDGRYERYRSRHASRITTTQTGGIIDLDIYP